MDRLSKQDKFTREAIIGLGEESIRKNYYPELQGKIIDLERTNARNKAIINTIPDIMLISDVTGKITPYASANSGHNHLLLQIMSNDIIIKELQKLVNIVAELREMRSYFFKISIDRIERSFEARLNYSYINEVLIIIRDVTEEKALEVRLRNLAERDSMTMLYNRRVFEEKLDALSDQTQVAIVIIDIDGLKLLNDTLGHQTGDDVILKVGSLVEQMFMDLGPTARLSGDEFGVAMSGIDESMIEARLRQMEEAILHFNEASDKVRISISYGYAISGKKKFNKRLLFKEADNNMYQKKMFKSASVRSSLVKTLMKALEARDFITEGHADRMEMLSYDLGLKVGLTDQQLDRLKLLAKFHDIGKVGIPDRILNKPGRLDEEEYTIMKTHTQIGKRIADESVDLRDISDLIYYHHERWDGKGYPVGLADYSIPVECRILGIVDAFDAMTNDRPYRKGLTIEAAIMEIKDNAGTQFDPELVKVFVEDMRLS